MKLSIDIDDEKIKGLLCCGFEGGIGYWAQIEDYKIVKGATYEDFQEGGRFQEPKNYYHPSQLIPLIEGCAVVIKDIQTHTDKKTFHLDLKAIHKGLEIMSTKYPEHFGDFLSDNTDAITGDVFIQCCIFGEIIYG